MTWHRCRHRKAAAFPVLLGLLVAMAALPAVAVAAAAPLRVRGRLVPPAGAAAPAGARVALYPAFEGYEGARRRLETRPGEKAQEEALATAVVGRDGSFELTAPGVGCFRATVVAAGYLPFEHPPFPLVAAMELPPAELQAASLLRLTVLTPEGRPAAGVEVHASREDYGEWASTDPWVPAVRRATTGRDGTALLPRGRYERLALTVATPAFSGRLRHVEDDQVTLHLTAAGTVQIAARAGGRPVPGALVRLGEPPWIHLGVTGEDGLLAVARSAAGSLPLLVEGPGGLVGVVEILAGERRATLPVALRPAEVLPGRVVSAATGKPLPGALVWSEGRPSGRWVQAGADGAFRLPVHRFPGLALGGGAAGHLPASDPLRPGSAVPLYVRLEPAAGIAGTVADSQGRPVAGARVHATYSPVLSHSQRRGHPATVWSDDGGRFRLERLQAGDVYIVEAFREGFAPGAARVLVELSRPGGSAGAGLRIVLSPGRTAAGRVADPEGRPVAGARVQALLLEGPPGGEGANVTSWQALSDASGAYELRDLGPGRYQLDASAPSFLPGQKPGLVVPRQGDRADWGVLTLQPGAVLEGRVVDGKGGPLAGANVSVHDPSSSHSWPFRSATTEPDGGFRVDELPPGKPVNLLVQHPTHLPVQVYGVEVPAPKPLVVEMGSGGTLSGRVVGPDGEPVADAWVQPQVPPSVVTTRRHASGLMVQRTDAEGRFRVGPLPAGLVKLEVSMEEYQQRDLTDLSVQVGRETEIGDVVLARGAVLEGRVLDAAGAPVPDVRLSFRCLPPERWAVPEARTDNGGRFRVAGLAPARFAVEAKGPWRQTASAEVDVSDGSAEVELRFPPGVEVSGRVLDREGAPLPGVSVSLRGPVDGGASMTGASGAFRFPWVAPGEYEVHATRAGYEPGRTGVIHVADLLVDGIELRLTPEGPRDGAVAGRLLGLSEGEARKVSIFAQASGRTAYAQGWPDGEGAYHIDGLAPGEWVIEGLVFGRRARGTVNLAPGAGLATLDLDFRWGEGFTLTGQVTAAQRPLADAWVTLARTDDKELASQSSALTGADGRFEIGGLAPGGYVLRLDPPDGALGHIRRLTLESDLDVTLDLETGAIEGRVTAADTGEPVAGAQVTFEQRDQPLGGAGYPIATTAEDGSFGLLALPPGSYVLRIRAQGFASTQTVVEVTGGPPARVEVHLRE